MPAFLATDDGGQRCSFTDVAALQAQIDRHHAEQPPACPSGWSDADTLFGRVDSADPCIVPLLVKDGCAVLSCVFGSLTTMCMLYQLSRKRAKGDTRRSMYHSISLGAGACGCVVLWAASTLLSEQPDQKVVMSFFIAFGVLGCEYASLASKSFLNNALDTMYSLRPARAAQWHGRVAMLWDVARPASLSMTLYGLACVCVGRATWNADMVSRGMAVGWGAVCAVFFLSAVLVAAGAIGTGHAAQSLGRSMEARPLRKKLRVQRAAAVLLTVMYGAVAIACAVFGFSIRARRLAGTGFGAVMAVMFAGATAALVPGVIRSARRNRDKRRRMNATVVHVAPSPSLDRRRRSLKSIEQQALDASPVVMRWRPGTAAKRPSTAGSTVSSQGTVDAPSHGRGRFLAPLVARPLPSMVAPTPEEAPARAMRPGAPQSSEPLVPLARRGVSLQFLRAFALQKCVPGRMTSAEVCAEIVKPATAATACAYFELLQRYGGDDDNNCDRGNGSAPVERWWGKSDYFFSHVSGALIPPYVYPR